MSAKPTSKDKKISATYGYSIPLGDFFTCAMSVDCVIFGYIDGEVKVLLIERGAKPFKGSWALPGDLMYPNEGLTEAASAFFIRSRDWKMSLWNKPEVSEPLIDIPLEG